MSVYISMLRGINVGGQKKVRMETLRGIYEGLGFTYVRTYVQSGNVAFETTEQDQSELAKRVEVHIEQTCGYPVAVFVRRAEDIQHILTSNPFLNNRNVDPTKLHVTFLYRPPMEAAWSTLTTPSGIMDEFAPGEMAVYLFCPNGYGKTKLSTSFFERKLGVPATTRNWNTVNALYSMTIDM